MPSYFNATKVGLEKNAFLVPEVRFLTEIRHLRRRLGLTGILYMKIPSSFGQLVKGVSLSDEVSVHSPQNTDSPRLKSL